MISPKELEKIKTYIREFFNFAEIEGLLKIDFQEPSTIKVTLQTEEAPILIGEGGETLLSLQSLLKKILSKQSNQGIFIELDINDYRAKKIKYLQELATTTADEVALTQHSKALEPMGAWERRIIHMTLAERSAVQTESQGQETQRHIVVSPLP